MPRVAELLAERDFPAPSGNSNSGALLHEVRRFQYARHLAVDGAIGPVTWSHLCTGDTLHERIIQHALCELYGGAKEIGGNNKGPWVKKYMGVEGQPWCVGFATWCYRQARKLFREAYPLLPFPGGPSWSSSALARWSKKHPEWETHMGMVAQYARAGDFIILPGGPTGFKHTTLCLEVAGNDVLVIEGNVRGGGYDDPAARTPGTRDAVRLGKYPARDVVLVRLKPLI